MALGTIEQLPTTAFAKAFGMGDFVDNELPGRYAKEIFQLGFAGAAPLTALLKSIRKESVGQTRFDWLAENPPIQGGDFTAGQVFTNPQMTVAYGGGGVVGTALYVKVKAAVAAEFKKTHEVTLRVSDQPLADCVGKCTKVELAGDDSKISLKLIEADDNGVGKDIRNADRILVSGNINPDFGMPPQAVNYQPSPAYNLCQIFKTLVKVTGRAEAATTRYGNKLVRERQRKFAIHLGEIEKAFIRGVRHLGVGENSEEETTTGGLIWFIREFAPQNLFNFRTETNEKYVGKSWAEAGQMWLNEVLEQVSYYKAEDSMGMRKSFAGAGAVSGINFLALQSGQFSLEAGQTSFGVKIDKWINPHMDIDMITHQALNAEPTERNRIIIYDPKHMEYMYFQKRDTRREDVTPKGLDGTLEQWRTDCGLMVDHPALNAVIDGVGLDHIEYDAEAA